MVVPYSPSRAHDDASYGAVTPGQARVALVAETRRDSRARLVGTLGRLGYEVIVASDGLGALDAYTRVQPELAFIDWGMVHGEESSICQQWSDLQTSARLDLDSLVWLMDAADEPPLRDVLASKSGDVLLRPFSESDLAGRLRSIERVRLLQLQVHELTNREQQEYTLAEEVFRTAVVAGNVAGGQIQKLLRPATHFSGDVLLSAYSPSGDLHVMLGDFTGHGLSAALGALPAAETFRAMTAKGFSIEHILRGINNKLCKMLPTGLFMAAQHVSVSQDLRHISVCNCGMPDVLVLDASGEIVNVVPSLSIPLGIMGDLDVSSAVQRIDVQSGHRVLLASDGVQDARDCAGAYFGRERFVAAVRAAAGERFALHALASELDRFIGDAPQDDDISLVEVPCVAEIIPTWHCTLPPAANNKTIDDVGTSVSSAVVEDTLEFSLTLHGTRLSQADPVPIIINQLQEAVSLGEHGRYLFTIITELFVNALDHGVLRLDSALKRGDDGFVRYMEERERALSQLKSGFIKIQVRASSEPGGAMVDLRVEDSGPGFDFLDQSEGVAGKTQYSGRGIRLVQSLCDSLTFEGTGNVAQATYRWNTKQ